MHSILGFLIGIPAVGFGLLTFLLWVWMLIDAIQNPRLVGTEKIVWILVIILLPCLGSVLYFFIGRSKG